jgi:CDP-glucose 4,6-dehydratase
MEFWQGRRVLVTGHTGFKGAWLAFWLAKAGARVTGFALEPSTNPSLFKQLNLEGDIEHRIGDIRDLDVLINTIDSVQPEIVLHLAAQSLVIRGYRDPIETWETNVIGSCKLLESLRKTITHKCAVVVITTDKVYWNNEWEYGYRESDRLGGYDPYSASKAATELVVECWRSSYFNGASPIRLASARAGNVIGGGDWSDNRIVPDVVRALRAGVEIEVRNPSAIRPWQHVLEPLGGYLLLAKNLYESGDLVYQDAFNFGPLLDAERSVSELISEAMKIWPGRWRDGSEAAALHEAGRLSLNIDRARTRLGWMPKWGFQETVQRTMQWYQQSFELTGAELRDLAVCEINDYLTSPKSG